MLSWLWKRHNDSEAELIDSASLPSLTKQLKHLCQVWSETNLPNDQFERCVLIAYSKYKWEPSDANFQEQGEFAELCLAQKQVATVVTAIQKLDSRRLDRFFSVAEKRDALGSMISDFRIGPP